jgi:AcrR family transcriptional regulator
VPQSQERTFRKQQRSRQETVHSRTMPPDVRRADLMDAAERLFVKKGFTNTRVDDLTRVAGVAKGTFYLYFHCKEDVLAALRDRFVVACRHRIADIAAQVPSDNWLGQLDAWVEGGVRHYLEHIQLHDVLFLGGDQEHGSMAHSPLVSELTQLIRAGAAGGAWSAENPELLSLFLFYALHGVVDYAVHGHHTNHDALIRLSQQIVRRAIGSSSLGSDRQSRRIKRS